jgi:hypothetical protein
MRIVRRYALAISVLLTFTFNSAALAAPRNGGGHDPVGFLKRLVVKILDDAGIKIGLPPG